MGEDWNWVYGDDDPGKPVFAVADGVVGFARDAGAAWGGVIVIEHTTLSGFNFTLSGGGFTGNIASMYGHADAARINEWFSEGDRVEAGDQVAVKTPRAARPHTCISRFAPIRPCTLSRDTRWSLMAGSTRHSSSRRIQPDN